MEILIAPKDHKLLLEIVSLIDFLILGEDSIYSVREQQHSFQLQISTTVVSYSFVDQCDAVVL